MPLFNILTTSHLTYSYTYILYAVYQLLICYYIPQTTYVQEKEIQEEQGALQNASVLRVCWWYYGTFEQFKGHNPDVLGAIQVKNGHW